MKVDPYVRISVIDGALEIVRHRRRYPTATVEDTLRQLKLGPSYLSGYDYQAAVQLGNMIGWDAFIPSDDRRVELRLTIMNVALRGQPLWVQAAIYGRDRVRLILTEDQEQCLTYAGLLEVPASVTTVQWWDQVASAVRSVREGQKLERGRLGEQLTIEYEKARLRSIGVTDRDPIWVSPDNNMAGYDVLSYDLDDNGGIVEIRIEVKSSASTPTCFILTRNEWDTAVRASSAHRFHIWHLPTRALSVFSVEDLVGLIPCSSGPSRWLNIEICIGPKAA